MYCKVFITFVQRICRIKRALYIRWKRLSRTAKLLLLVIGIISLRIVLQLIWPPLIGGISCPRKVSLYSEDEYGKPSFHSECQVIHIGMSCFDETEIHGLVATMKIILLHTHSVAKFHIVTNSGGYRILSYLFKTWELQHVDVEITVSDQVVNPVKYFLIRELHNLHMIIIIKPSTLLYFDIRQIYEVIKTSTISINEIFQKVYTATHLNSQKQIPAIRSKAWVLNLAVIRKTKFCGNKLILKQKINLPHDACFLSPTQWNICNVEETVKNSVGSYSSGLCGTGVSESVYFVKKLLCDKNDIVKPPSEDVLPSITVIEQQHNILLEEALHNTSGDVLRMRKVLQPCRHKYHKPVHQYNKALEEEDYCYQYRYSACLSRRVHLYFHNTTRTHFTNKNEVEITLVTQLQFNRLDKLEILTKAWDGPMHAVLYLTDLEAQLFYNKITKEKTFDRKSSVFYHVVYKYGDYNPINFLRNVGLNLTYSDYVFIADVDFVPTPGIYDKLLQLVKSDSGELNKAFLVPTFETALTDYSVPEDKTDFIEDIQNGIVFPYHQSGFRVFKAGHRPHNYAKWMTANRAYQVYYAEKFEPYIVLKTSDSPLYQEILTERMQDKFSYTLEVHLKKILFFVAHDIYLVHTAHELSASIDWYKKRSFRRCKDYFYYCNISASLYEKYTHSYWYYYYKYFCI